MTTSLFDIFPPKAGRVHEACGAGAFGFAAALAAAGSGPVMWVAEGWRHEVVNPVGFSAFADPARLFMARAGSPDEALAVAEEALRDGAVPLVVIEVGRALSLKAGRRLQLAAKAGRSRGLCLISEEMGSNAAETRWRCTPVFDGDGAGGHSTLQRWELIKNKAGTCGAWNVRWDAAARRLDVVPPAGQRPQPPGAAG